MPLLQQARQLVVGALALQPWEALQGQLGLAWAQRVQLPLAVAWMQREPWALQGPQAVRGVMQREEGRRPMQRAG